MSEGNRKKLEALDRLAEELVQDILLASDEEILFEAAEDEPDLAQYLADSKSVYKLARKSVGRQAYETARLAVQHDKVAASTSSVLWLSAEKARKLLESVIKTNSADPLPLKLAARKGGDLSDSDVQSLLEDLRELGVISSILDQDADE